METIRYKLHFEILILAVIALPLIWKASDNVLFGDTRFYSLFGLVGALHATSLVISIRGGIAIARRVGFVVLAAVLSALTIILAEVISPVLEVIPLDSARFLLFLALASAVGASGYWLLVRCFWLKSLRFNGLIITIGVCTAATLLSWGAAILILSVPGAWHGGIVRTTPGVITDVLPTAAWWAAFSGSLYWNETGRHRLNSR